MEWLRKYEEEEAGRCRKLTDVPLYRAQGAAEALETILSVHGSAAVDLDKFKQQPQKP